MISGTTSTGFKFTIDERIKTDWRLVKMINDFSSADQNVQIDSATRLVELLFSDKGQALEKHVADMNEGFCPVDKLFNEISEILTSNEDLKK